MTTPHTSLDRPRSADVDRRILAAAYTLMTEAGYARMSIHAVAAAAGVTTPSIYLRYRDKAALAAAAIAENQHLEAGILHGDVRLNLIDQLHLLRLSILEHSGGVHPGSVIAQKRETPELVDLFHFNVVLPRRQAIYCILERGCAEGTIAKGTDCATVATLLVGVPYMLYLTDTPFSENWAEQTVDALLRGLMVMPPH